MTVAEVVVPELKLSVVTLTIDALGRGRPDPLHAAKHSNGGIVNINVTAPCLIEFTNPDIFNMASAKLMTGNNALSVMVEGGTTNYSTCVSKTGPNEIVVG